MSATLRRHTYYGGESSDVVAQVRYSHRSRRSNQPKFGPYYVGATLGVGEFGKVKLCWTSSNTDGMPKHVAIKLIRRDTISQMQENENKIYREINALKMLHHPNVVRLEEVLQNSKYIGIVLEYASGGELYKLIQRKKRLKETQACSFFAQLISGVTYMHSKGLVHRDLKLENLLLDKCGKLIITDFGFVNEFSSQHRLMNTPCGSPCYAAPELVRCEQPYEPRKADIWSCGVILYAMLAGYLPWDDDLENPDGNNISRLYHYIVHSPLKFPEYITPLPRDILRRTLICVPTERLSGRAILKHEWLSPHVEILNVTAEDWDKMAVETGAVNTRQSNTKPKSRPLSVCSTLSWDNRRDSLILSSALTPPQPAPPKELQLNVMGSPSVTSLNSTAEINLNASGLFRHRRSSSAASIALQAVVKSDPKLASRTATFDVPQKKSQTIDNIIETSLDETQILNSMNQIRETTKQHRKPRPTSYHPGILSGTNAKIMYTYASTQTKTSDSELTLPSDSTSNVRKDNVTFTLSAASSSSTVQSSQKIDSAITTTNRKLNNTKFFPVAEEVEEEEETEGNKLNDAKPSSIVAASHQSPKSKTKKFFSFFKRKNTRV